MSVPRIADKQHCTICGSLQAGVSNRLMEWTDEWNISWSAKQIEPAQIVVLVSRHTLRGPCATIYF